MPGRALALALALVGLAAGAAAAEPLRRDQVPEPLRPWVEWALQGHEDALCSSLLGDAERRQCAWPSRLDLALDESGGTFTQEWDVQRALWLPLPGAAKPWPQDVTVDGAPAVVIEQNGAPQVWLTNGRHTVGGRFAWDRLPEILPVPASTGLVSLALRGQAVPFPNRDADGRLWLQRREEASDESDRVGVIVHRLVDDGVPLLLDTRIQLEVSGRGREVTLGPALPAGFTPMLLDSPLPARLETDGRLRMQLRAGRWALRIVARHDGPAATLAAPEPQDAWATNEIWVFQAHPDLRLVTIEDADAVDPQQTDLPDDWRKLPAYVMRPGATMKLVERRRGDTDAAADQLALTRTLWLDFDGGGYTMHDRITGTLARAWRLDMAPPTLLGRVAVDGTDQFITRLSAEAPSGVEIRAGALTLDADSRLDGDTRALPAVGWLHDFQSLSAQLQLPPGWRLLHATGVDQARPTWVATWTLLDLFIVLITALATARLFGWAWGLLALLAVGLTYTESDAPAAIWIAALAAEALVRVVPDGTARRALQLVRILTLAALVIIAVPFLISQMRQALYPALEHPWFSMDRTAPNVATAPETEEGDVALLGRMRAKSAAPPGESDSLGASGEYRSYEYAAVDPKSVVQTGPGLPGWSWNTVSLDWSGPVDRDQQLHLVLLSPSVNLLLAVLRTLLLAVLVARLVGLRPRAGAAGAAALLAALTAGAAPARADFPSDELLESLRTRLLEPPACHPWCAALPRMRLEVDAHTLRARMRIDAAAPTAVPLPGQQQHWLPGTVIVDGHAAEALMQGADGWLWLRLDAGRHEVLIEGALPARDTVQIPLLLAPRLVETQIDGWTLEGVHGDGAVDANLQLSRTAPTDGAQAAPLQADQLPSFARVERTLRLGLTWQVETRVVRLTPPDSALLLSVPLLAGESVTTADVRVADGRAQINLAPQVAEAVWQSILAERSPIALRAPEGVQWVELWRLDAGPIWHVDASGIAPVLRGDANAPPLREWRPWPGESVALDVVRPQGVPGQTLTIDESELSISPGLRATDGKLTMTVRSSRGAQHPITLPAGAELLMVAIDDVAQPVRLENGVVVLPIDPGPQKIELRWRQPDGMAARFRSPVVDLGAPSVNAYLDIAVPPSRWILFAGGPRLGPAVLFWSLLPVLALAAFGLGRVRTTPLRFHHWLLLGIGLTQVPIAAAVAVAGWLLAIGWRRGRGAALSPRGFDLVQVLLVAWTLAAIGILFYAIQQGLLGQPEMQIAGNGSSAEYLRWYQDRSGDVLPQAWIVSTPLLVYRLLMLAWALWIAAALLRWLRWAWDSFGSGGYWHALRTPKVTPPAPVLPTPGS
ncbi:MAG TPA: hypothetical protein VL049_30155 [Candidatus Dormibacteraeota bacterium]|nr:hypothetical protein [Candidatus Dormibacteraeota bacterium]